MNIKEAAAQCGITPRMIRYYEETGVLPEAARGAVGGYRDYSDDDVETLKIISSLRDLGIEARAIRDLLQLTGTGFDPATAKGSLPNSIAGSQV